MKRNFFFIIFVAVSLIPFLICSKNERLKVSSDFHIVYKVFQEAPEHNSLKYGYRRQPKQKPAKANKPVKGKTPIVKTNLNTTLLFATWTIDPDGPHADFVLSRKSFYVVDYDGNGDMAYELKGKHLKVFYPDNIQQGDILALSKDTLTIKWQGAAEISDYVRWIN